MEERIGRVTGINISKEKGVIKDPIEKGYFRIKHGLEGDAHAGDWHRQVSLLAQESIDKMTMQGVDGLSSGKFAENLTTTGIELHKLPVGTLLKIGETLQEVTQIGKECHKGCAIREQVGDCIMPREGIFTKVLSDGQISVGDDIFRISKE